MQIHIAFYYLGYEPDLAFFRKVDGVLASAQAAFKLPSSVRAIRARLARMRLLQDSRAF